MFKKPDSGSRITALDLEYNLYTEGFFFRRIKCNEKTQQLSMNYKARKAFRANADVTLKTRPIFLQN